MIDKIKEKLGNKYKKYKENKAVENKVYKEAYRKEKLKVIKRKAIEDAKSGGTVGKLKKFAKETLKKNQLRQKKEKKEIKWL